MLLALSLAFTPADPPSRCLCSMTSECQVCNVNSLQLPLMLLSTESCLLLTWRGGAQESQLLECEKNGRIHQHCLCWSRAYMSLLCQQSERNVERCGLEGIEPLLYDTYINGFLLFKVGNSCVAKCNECIWSSENITLNVHDTFSVPFSSSRWSILLLWPYLIIAVANEGK